jgi:iron complex outermembrane receptor protein
VVDSRDEQSDQAFTGRVGLTYLTSFGLAPYASYSTSFAPTLGRGADGRAFVPTTGRQAEIGVKYQPPGSSSIFTAAVFDIQQDHGLAPDPSNPTVYQVQTGKIRSRGLELEAATNPMPGLDLTAAYTYLDMTFLDGDADTVGKMPSGIPHHQASIWADYTVQPGHALAGFGIGIGTRYIGRIYGDDQNSFSVAGVGLLDAAVHYELANLDKRLSGARLQVNATNLLDREYQSCQAAYCYWGEGRTVLASLRYRW